MTLKGGKTLRPPLPSLVSVPRHIISTLYHLHSAPHHLPPRPTPLYLPPPVQNEKSVIFIKRPTKYYLHSIPEDRILFRGDGIRHLFLNFILHELYFLSTLDKIITRSIRFLATTRLHIFSLCGLFTVWVNFLSHIHTNTCRTPSAADRNLNAAGLM